LKPDPGNSQDLFLHSLSAIGITKYDLASVLLQALQQQGRVMSNVIVFFINEMKGSKDAWQCSYVPSFTFL